MIDFTSSLPGRAGLRVVADVQPPVLTVHLRGELDLACVDLLEAITTVDLDGVTTVVVDLAELDFTDSAGIKAMLRLRAAQLEGDRTVRFVNIRPIVRRVFVLTGSAHVLAA